MFEFDLRTGTLKNLIRWNTPTSGGKANAIEFNPFIKAGRKVELVLTDDELGSVYVVEFDLPTKTLQVVSQCLIDEQGIGASHAVWVS